jgi:type IV secretion system protein VirD4
MGRVLSEDFYALRRYPLLLLLDEFPTLGRLDFFESALAYLAGYDIRAFLVAQSLNQLDHAYGQHNSIMDNCHVKVTFAANDDQTAARISALLGTATDVRMQASLSGGRFALMLTHQSQTQAVSARPLLTPGEVLQLPEQEALILRAGLPPIRASKLRYYTDPRLLARVLPPPDLGTLDVPLSFPSPWLFEGPKAVQEQGA